MSDGYPPAWDEIVTCTLCGHTSRAQWKRTGYRDGTWLCLSRRACTGRQRRMQNIKAHAVRRAAAARGLSITVYLSLRRAGT